jgi:hypothetical protein
MAVRPPVCAATAPDADIFRSLRRVMRAMISPCPLLCVGIARSPHLRGPRRRFAKPGVSRPKRPAEVLSGRDASGEYTDLTQTVAQSATGALALGPWKHALTGSREISAIFKRSSKTQVTWAPFAGHRAANRHQVLADKLGSLLSSAVNRLYNIGFRVGRAFLLKIFVSLPLGDVRKGHIPDHSEATPYGQKIRRRCCGSADHPRG